MSKVDPRRKQLEKKIAQLMEDSTFDHCHWGIHIETAEGQVLHEQNADKAFWPGELMQLITAAQALCNLGHDFQLQTAYSLDGDIVGDTLEGNIVITGQGDPMCGSDVDRFSYLQGMAKFIKKELEIRKVIGAVVTNGLVAVCRDLRVSDLDSADFRICSQVIVGEGVREVIVTPAKRPGDLASIKDPEADEYFGPISSVVDTTVRGEGADVFLVYVSSMNQWALAGKIAVDAKPEHVFVPDNHPANLAARRLEDCLKKEGVTVKTPKMIPRYAPETAGGEPFVVSSSPPLSTMVDVMLSTRSEFISNQLYLATACILNGLWAFETAELISGDWMESIGLPDLGGLRQVDGAGAARTNSMTPRAMTAFLRHMRTEGKEGEVFFETLRPPTSESGPIAQFINPLTGESGVFSLMTFLNNVWGIAGVISDDVSGDSREKDTYFCLLVNGPSEDLLPDDTLIKDIVLILKGQHAPD